MKINNEMKMFHPSLDWEGVSIIGTVISVIAVIMAVLVCIEHSSLGLLLLLFPLWYPVGRAFRSGHTLKRLGWEYVHYSETQNSKVLLYEQYRSLPEPVRKQVGSLSVEDVLEFSPDDAAILLKRMEGLSESYNEAQRILTVPRVTMMMHAIEDAKTCYDEQARVNKEIEE